MFVHSTGLVDDRKEHIDGTLSMDTIPTLPPPSFDARRTSQFTATLAVFRGPAGNPRVGSLWNHYNLREEGRALQIVQMQARTTAATSDDQTEHRGPGFLRWQLCPRTGAVTVIARQGDMLVVGILVIPTDIAAVSD